LVSAHSTTYHHNLDTHLRSTAAFNEQEGSSIPQRGVYPPYFFLPQLIFS
jgi:hypothetical protein